MPRRTKFKKKRKLYYTNDLPEYIFFLIVPPPKTDAPELAICASSSSCLICKSFFLSILLASASDTPPHPEALFSSLLRTCQSIPHTRQWGRLSLCNQGEKQVIRGQLIETLTFAFSLSLSFPVWLTVYLTVVHGVTNSTLDTGCVCLEAPGEGKKEKRKKFSKR